MEKRIKTKEGGRLKKTDQVRISTTDPESGFLMRDGKPRGFFSWTIEKWMPNLISLRIRILLQETYQIVNLIGND
jgi:hypothetical protein